MSRLFAPDRHMQCVHAGAGIDLFDKRGVVIQVGLDRRDVAKPDKMRKGDR